MGVGLLMCPVCLLAGLLCAVCTCWAGWQARWGWPPFYAQLRCCCNSRVGRVVGLLCCGRV